jgi:hypothetical protein
VAKARSAVPIINVLLVMVGTLGFAHPCISAKDYTGIVP